MEDIRKGDHDILLQSEGKNISQTCKSYYNTEKSKQPCLAFKMFYKCFPNFSSAPSVLTITYTTGGGREER